MDRTRYQDDVNDFFSNLQDADFEEVSCILCKDNPTIELFKKGTMEVHRCKCGFVFNKRQPKQSVLNNFYAESNAMNKWVDIKKSKDENQRQVNKFQKVATYINENDSINSLLDIGCGTGKFLSMLNIKQKLGTEPNESSREAAKKSGLCVSDKIPEGETWDAISMFGVLEHLKDPIGWLEECTELLKENGHLFIIVPNVESEIVQRAWGKTFTFCPQHLWYFCINSLSISAEKAGYHLVDFHTIEPECKESFIASEGLDPYNYEWYDEDFLAFIDEKFGQEVLDEKKGYKIVAHFQKDQTEPSISNVILTGAEK